MEEDPSENYSEQDDDLADFEEYQQEKINQEVMNAAPGHKVEDDAKYIQQQKEPNNKDKKKKQISEEQRRARQLKLLNSRKYFEIAKIMYLQHVSSAIKETNQINSTYKQVVAKWLSMLSPSLIEQFFELKKTKPLSIKITDYLKLLKQAQKIIMLKGKQKPNWSIFFWSFCQYLGLGLRKVHFFNIDSIVEQVFFQLKYHSSELQRKKQNKKSKHLQAIKISISQQIQQNIQQEEEHSNSYIDFQDYQFDHDSFKQKKQKRLSEINKNQDQQKKQQKRQNNFIRKKNYKHSYFQLFDPSSNQWVLINSQILQIQDHQKSKKTVLEGKFIVGFFSTRILHFKEHYDSYSSLRNLQKIVIEDLTMYFEDNYRHLASRRKRLGLKWIMRRIFEESSQIDKSTFMLSNYDEYLYEQNQRIQLEYNKINFPKTKEEMATSTFFIVPSLIPRYSILDEKAKPLSDLMFNQQAVYLRKNIKTVTSKLFWIDRGRRVRLGQLPIKKTQNKSKNVTQLYLYEQTVPFTLPIQQETGNFIPDDEFNSIYIPSNYSPPEGLKILNLKISMVCNKAKIRHVKVVRGFHRSMGRILPNQIGFLIYEQDEQQILQLYEQRQTKLQENKSKNRIKQLTSLWNKLFKKIQLSDWTKSFQDKY